MHLACLEAVVYKLSPLPEVCTWMRQRADRRGRKGLCLCPSLLHISSVKCPVIRPFSPCKDQKIQVFLPVLSQGPGIRLEQLNKEFFFYITFRNILRKSRAGRNFRVRPHLKLGKSHLSTSLCLDLEQQH